MDTIFIDLFVLYFISGDLDASVHSVRIKSSQQTSHFAQGKQLVYKKRVLCTRSVCVAHYLELATDPLF